MRDLPFPNAMSVLRKASFVNPAIMSYLTPYRPFMSNVRRELSNTITRPLRQFSRPRVQHIRRSRRLRRPKEEPLNLPHIDGPQRKKSSATPKELSRLPPISKDGKSKVKEQRQSPAKETQVEPVQKLPNVESHGPRKKSSSSLAVPLWVHRFLYISKKKSSERREKAKAVEEEAKQTPGDKLVTQSSPNLVQLGRPVDRPISWTMLRRKLIKAKITDALTSVKFTVNGKVFTSLRMLGEGGYAKVYEVFNHEKELFALKVIKIEGLSETMQEEVMQEIRFLKKFQSDERVVTLIEYDHQINDEGNTLYIRMERGECDLNSILDNLTSAQRLTPARLRYFWEQMLEGVQAIHDQRIIHADLKPANFILVRGVLKVIDFGLAGELKPGETTLERKFVGGTRDYMSPESMSCYVISDGAMDFSAMRENRDQTMHVSFKSDVWALGVILYQLAYGGVAPYSAVPGGKLGKLKAVLDRNIPVDFEPLADYTLLDTLKRCLEKDPEKRATIAELLSHTFLRPVPYYAADDMVTE